MQPEDGTIPLQQIDIWTQKPYNRIHLFTFNTEEILTRVPVPYAKCACIQNNKSIVPLSTNEYMIVFIIIS